MAIVKKAMRAIQRLGHKVVNMPNDVDAAVRTEPATNDYPRLKAEGDLYASQTAELTAHNHALTEAVTKYRSQVQELERELLAARTEIAMYPRLKAERDFYASQTEELTAHNRLLRNDYPRLKAEREFYFNQMTELTAHNEALTKAATNQMTDLTAHNEALTKAATKFARMLQGHLEVREDLPSLPSVLFTSIPESGTVFTGQMLLRGLGLELVRVTVGSFPRYLFDLPRLIQFSGGGMIATEHFDASQENLQFLGALVDRWVVHIRDPRAVLVSWVHNLDRLYQDQQTAPHHLLYVCPTPPEPYFGFSFSDKVDWNIEHFLPNVLNWTKTWIEAHDSGRHNILLTTISEITAGEDDFLFKILDFYGISRELFRRPEIEKDDDLHFRVGQEEEWQVRFTPGQLARTRDMIDSELLERFGWPR